MCLALLFYCAELDEVFEYSGAIVAEEGGETRVRVTWGHRNQIYMPDLDFIARYDLVLFGYL